MPLVIFSTRVAIRCLGIESLNWTAEGSTQGGSIRAKTAETKGWHGNAWLNSGHCSSEKPCQTSVRSWPKHFIRHHQISARLRIMELMLSCIIAWELYWCMPRGTLPIRIHQESLIDAVYPTGCMKVVNICIGAHQYWIILSCLGTVPMNDFLKQTGSLRLTVILKRNLVF